MKRTENFNNTVVPGAGLEPASIRLQNAVNQGVYRNGGSRWAQIGAQEKQAEELFLLVKKWQSIPEEDQKAILRVFSMLEKGGLE